jgi:hypothetical protein
MSNSQDGPEAAPAPRASFWIRELPFLVVLILTLLGVAVYELCETADRGLLVVARTDHRTDVCGQGVAIRQRPRGAISPDLDAGPLLARIPGRDEPTVFAKCATDPKRSSNWRRHSQLIGARHLHRRRAGALLAGRRAGARDGHCRPGERVDRTILIDRHIDCRGPDWAFRRGSVALAQTRRSPSCKLG